MKYCYFCGPFDGQKPRWETLVESRTMKTEVCPECMAEFLPDENGDDPPTQPTIRLR